MTGKLFLGAIVKFLLGVALVGTLIFLPAGTLNFLNGWLLMAILFVPMFVGGVVMMVKNPPCLPHAWRPRKSKRRRMWSLSSAG